MRYSKNRRSPRFWNFRCRRKGSAESKASHTKRLGGKGKHRIPVSCQYREWGNDPQPACCDTVYQDLRPACGTLLQSRSHVGGKRRSKTGQPQAETLPGAVFTNRGWCHWRSLENQTPKWRNGGWVKNILCFLFYGDAQAPSFFAFFSVHRSILRVVLKFGNVLLA